MSSKFAPHFFGPVGGPAYTRKRIWNIKEAMVRHRKFKLRVVLMLTWLNVYENNYNEIKDLANTIAARRLQCSDFS